MGLIWDRGGSQKFTGGLSSSIHRWQDYLGPKRRALQAAADAVSSGQLTGKAYNAAKTLIVDRIIPLVDSAERLCVWVQEDIDEYTTAENSLSSDTTHLDEDQLLAALADIDASIQDTMIWMAARDRGNGAPVQHLEYYLWGLRESRRGTQMKIDALRAFSQRVSGVFDNEMAQSAALAAGLDSIVAGSLAADGTYVPTQGDSEPWRGQVDAYNLTHPLDPREGAKIAHMEKALVAAGIVTQRPVTTEEYLKWAAANRQFLDWVTNAVAHGIAPATVVDICQQAGLTADSFNVLAGLTVIKDDLDKSYFVLPGDVTPETAEKITLMTYIYNCGTDYGSTGGDRSYRDVPYGADEVARIQQRIAANNWSYDLLVPMLQDAGGQAVATPNGMLMGLSFGVEPVDVYSVASPGTAPGLPPRHGSIEAQSKIALLSQGGGTTYGDVFLLNKDASTSPLGDLTSLIQTGSMPGDRPNTAIAFSQGVDRLLHHEEIHSRQWADRGGGYGLSYLLDYGAGHGFSLSPDEQDAGLADGGYPDPPQ